MRSPKVSFPKSTANSVSERKYPWHISEDGTVYKQARSSRHMLRSPEGWAVDIHTLVWAIEKGCENMMIIDKDTKRIYKAPLQLFRSHGVHIEWGYGPQVCLPVEYWEVSHA